MRMTNKEMAEMFARTPEEANELEKYLDGYDKEFLYSMALMAVVVIPAMLIAAPIIYIIGKYQ